MATTLYNVALENKNLFGFSPANMHCDVRFLLRYALISDH